MLAFQHCDPSPARVPSRSMSRVSTHSTAEIIRSPRVKSQAGSAKALTITRAMRAYVERVAEHNDMMKAEVAQYETGKRHLANIMGQDHDTFTQDDVNKAIEYLLPNGMYNKKARPVMKDPHEVFPRRKAAQFSADGRPFHWMYFTTKPNYYNILYDINWKMEDLKALEDNLNKKTRQDKEKKENTNNTSRSQEEEDEATCKDFKNITLARSEWITKETLEINTVEKIKDDEYAHFITLLERVCSHPLAYMQSEFIMQYRLEISLQALQIEVPKIETDENGRTFARAEGIRKRCPAWVKVYYPGTGKVSINDQDLGQFFKNHIYRESLLTPLIVTDLVGEVDIEAKVDLVVERWIYNNFHEPKPEHFRKGPSSYCGAIRLGLARALTAFVSSDHKENLRLAGLLTEDKKLKERKRPGQEKARKKFTWKRR